MFPSSSGSNALAQVGGISRQALGTRMEHHRQNSRWIRVEKLGRTRPSQIGVSVITIQVSTDRCHRTGLDTVLDKVC